MPIPKLLSYADLVHLGVVNNRTQLSRLKKRAGFPAGFLLSANSRRWHENEIEEWVMSANSQEQTLGYGLKARNLAKSGRPGIPLKMPF
jgi:predicted DNA-binding transcriptional regulator AlpA